MAKIKGKNLIKVLSPLISLGAFLVLWLVVAKIVNVEVLLPSPEKVISAFFELICKGDFYAAVLGTLGRATLGFVISMALALGFAVLSLVSRAVEHAIEPLVVIARATPTMSIILLALVWLNANLSPVLVGVLISFPALYSALIGGIKGVDPGLIQMSKVYKVGLKRRITSLYVPCIVPSFAGQCASTASLNLKVVIAGEVLAQTTISMGVEMQIAKVLIEMPILFAWTAVAIILSFLLETAIKACFRLLPGGKVCK